MLIAIMVFIALGAILGAGLGYASQVLKVAGNPLVDEIEQLMPGGQCGQCGEAGCRQAAEAMVRGELAPSSCPPGGGGLAIAIADILGVSLEASDEDIQWVAHIDEAKCSGCTRCYKACPFDAIVGSSKQMHTVLQDVCTGCRLCEAACSQNCLSMQQVPQSSQTWFWPKPSAA